ncbi:MAG: phenylacetic acid degradation protein PaaN [Gammaproteobacteria bacterium]|nr:phenylacetic acid degradation protein PaaN [Gammaproteobacteria bacterium]
MSTAFFERHQQTLQNAMEACRSRAYWSAYSERPSPREYGETAAAEGQAAFEGRLDKPFSLEQPGTVGQVGEERSPYGRELGVKYPKADLDALLASVEEGRQDWARASIDTRAGVCLEILDRINKRSFEMAQAVMHTTGQGFMMAFQAGGPHAQDRALEAVAYAYEEMKRTPAEARWEKPQGKNDPLRMEKRYHVVPRGVGLVIGVSTFPTWNSYPAIFANLATGNAVIVKPHPGAVLPLAITVEVAREVLREAGFDPNVITLVADTKDAPVTKELATRLEIGIVDFTGGSAFGEWLEANVRAPVFTEKSGVNCIVIDSTDNLKGMANNLAFTLSLYSGQMCTTPQNIFVPANGIETDQGHKSFDEVAAAITGSLDKLLGEDERAVQILGGIQNDATEQRIAEAAKTGRVLLDSRTIEHPEFKDAHVRTPLIIEIDASEDATYEQELFGPIAFIVRTANTQESLARVLHAARKKGAITFGVYSTDEQVLEAAGETAMKGGVALSENLTGGVYVNQTAAFSDYHATGANPAANSCFSDAAFVANRFRVVQSRRHAA